MRSAWITVLSAGLVVGLAVPAMADYYDSFADGEFYGGFDPNDPNWYTMDPNFWDIDNPAWTIVELIGNQFVYEVVGTERWMRLYVDHTALPILAFLAGLVDYGDDDPNTSSTWFDDSSSHYIMARSANGTLNDDPNKDKAKINLIMSGDPRTWRAFLLTYEYADDWPYRGAWFAMQTTYGTDSHSLGSEHVNSGDNYRWYPGSPDGYEGETYWPDRVYYYLLDPLYDPNDPKFWTGRASWAPQFDPNYYPNVPDNLDPSLYDPNDPNWQDPRDPNWMLADWNMVDPNNYWADANFMDEHNGFWMCMQLEIVDANYPPGDPNGKWLRAACWNGGKFDWDGTWIIQKDFSGDIDNDPDPNTSWWPEWYWFGDPLVWQHSGVSVQADNEFGLPADVAYDNIAARHGVFTNVGRWLTLKLKDCTEITVDPDLLAEPNGDPNDMGLKRRYTDGTAIVLHSVVPKGSKTFKKWNIKGPNQSGDPCYQEVKDTNEIVYLTMIGDYEVKVTCKCGGGGVEPFAAIVLVVLGLGVAIRRLT